MRDLIFGAKIGKLTYVLLVSCIHTKFHGNRFTVRICKLHAMASDKDIRWIQRLSNFSKALRQLQKFNKKGDLNELEEQGLIKSFEYTYELAWDVLKAFYEDQGETGIQGSKDAIRMAFSRGLIGNAEIWMEMVESRKLTVHTYDEKTASAIISIIKTKYLNSFLELHSDLEKIRSGNQTSLLL